MKNQEVVTFAKFSDFLNDEGQQVKSGRLFVLGKKTHKKTDFGESAGNQTASLKCDIALVKDVLQKGLPGIYNIDYDVSIDRDGGMILVPIALEFVKEIKLL